ncbi:hypothetical protein evm_013018 [Chilo suppressalis]|nr:hypothetical protein evm_013018 [Chilo suppressalis]
MFFHWKEEHKIERMSITTVDRPAVSVMISMEKCVFRRRSYVGNICVYDIITKSDISLPKHNVTMPKNNAHESMYT